MLPVVTSLTPPVALPWSERCARLAHEAPPDLAVFISLSGAGGVEKMVFHLLHEWAHCGLRIDLVLLREHSPHLGALPAGVRVIALGVQHHALSVGRLRDYLQCCQPPVLLAAKDRAGRVALKARAKARVTTRIYIRLGTHLSAALADKAAWLRWLRIFPMRRLYAQADGVIAVSAGVGEDVSALTGLETARIHCLPNPVITPTMLDLAKAPCPHPWLEDAALPVIMGIGRLTRQKDFATLLRAFAHVRQQHPARLLILGEGAQRQSLQHLSLQLGVAEHVQFPGFAQNPYAWLARARLFVLSSRWEGSPNVLTEALALGVPVVATDCPSGPRELLQDGRLGRLVRPGDNEDLAMAMLATLYAPQTPGELMAAVQAYQAASSANGYLQVLGLLAGADTSPSVAPGHGA
ncbi:glycosyltransferase [Thiorhodospira sibirica]|uniref:glycosyltransferase n=1 Tax=Thiorhodospira sibirica TaxID=154347 RepID=UPI00022C1759